MLNKLYVQPLGWLARIADILMTPVMYVISGTLRETPQRTHRWNNTKLRPRQRVNLQTTMAVFCKGRKENVERFWFCIPRFHLPLFGGWKEYVVLQPNSVEAWHVGWIGDDVAGVSRIKIQGPVRLLVGPKDVSFFGVNTEGVQIQLYEVARGRIGNRGEYAKIPLL